MGLRARSGDRLGAPVAIIQARMGSTRLPGKVLYLLGTLPIVGHVYQRTKLAVRNTVVAIPNSAENDPLHAYLATLDAPVFRWDGAEDDVLGRYAACARKHRGDCVVRITADCPLVDPSLVLKAVDRFRRYEHVHYVSNVTRRSYPRGLDVEVMSYGALQAADRIANAPEDREHVTPLIRRHAPRMVVQQKWHWWSDLRWCVDTPEDYDWFRQLTDYLPFTPPYPTTRQLVKLLETHPHLVRKDVAA